MIALVIRSFGLLVAGGLAFAATSLDREIVLVLHAGNRIEDREISRWQEQARQAGATAETFERLAWAYVAKARITLDGGFYKLAEKTADVVEAEFGVSAESRLVRGHVLHNLHHFREAEEVARLAVADRGSPADLALLSDALIEQGKLKDGAAALQRLADLKPGVEALSRIAYVRWLKGDLAGAQSALESAIQTSSVHDAETRAWLLVRLSGLCLQRGDATLALKLAEGAAERLPEYPPALLARGRALVALGRTEEAIGPLQRAEQLQPLPEYQWWLADVLKATGRSAEAAEVECRLRRRGADSDPRTYALYLVTRHEELDLALQITRSELKRRADVFSHDARAWSLAAAGDRAADAEMQAALAEGTKDARLLLHAGKLAQARGDETKAAAFLAEACAMAGTLTPSEKARLAEWSRAATDLAAR